MRSWRPKRVLNVLVLLLLPLAVACGDVITLDDGSVLEGEIMSPANAAIIELRITAGGVQAIQHIDRHHVVRIDLGPSPHQRLLGTLLAKANALGEQGSAEAWVALARQAMAADEHALARRYALEAVLRDRHQLEARALLGEVLQNGVWMLPREAAVARGEVFYDGHWMSWQAREDHLQQALKLAHDATVERDKLLAAEHDQHRLHELEQAEYGSPSNDPFNAGYAGGTTGYGYVGASSYGDGFYEYGPYLAYIGGGWYHHHYGHGFGSGVDVVISGNSRHSQWALNLHW
jgi:hypothetical protein